MLTSSLSPPVASTSSPGGPASSYSPHPYRDSRTRGGKVSSPIVKPHSTHVYPEYQHSQQPTTRCSPTARLPNATNPARYQSTSTQTSIVRPGMVDATTQYSPPITAQTPTNANKLPITPIAQLRVTDTVPSLSNFAESSCSSTSEENETAAHAAMHSEPSGTAAPSTTANGQTNGPTSSPSSKRSYEDEEGARGSEQIKEPEKTERASSKKQKPEEPAVRIMPIQYETCNTRDLVILIASMLMELIRYNDGIPLRDGQLTRFHSRAPPGISVLDYLQRLTTHATLSPPILLSMVYYIDRLCALYPAFTMTSLTVHRFLITSATVASKGLSDSFWTNRTYARVGGVSVRELALLEMDFLVKMKWKIVPKPETLVDYYRSLVERSPGYEMEVKVEHENKS